MIYFKITLACFKKNAVLYNRLRNHNNTAADRINTGAKKMKAKAVQRILNDLEDMMVNVKIVTTKGNYTYLSGSSEDLDKWSVDTEENILHIENSDDGTAWIDTDSIISIEI